jgi:predicted MFS family arabinose efflux permease
LTADSSAHLQRHRTPFDSWRSMTLSLYMALVGYGVSVGVPVISTAWVELLGFTEVQVGRVAGADLGGLALGALITSLVIAGTNRRHLILLGAGLAILSNAACVVFVAYEEVLWLRLLAGIGSGIYTAVAVASLGATSRPARSYNLMLFAFAFSQALEMHVLPQLSMNGIYGVFIGAFALGLLVVHWIPPYPAEKSLDVEIDVPEETGEHRIVHRHVPKYVPWLCLCAIVLTYVNIGGYWAYIELASLDAGIADEWIGQILVWASFSSIAGCLIATVLSNRFGLARPLLGALVAMVTIVGMLALGINDINILISVFSFNLLWVFVDVYQMSTIANVDHSGSFASLMPGAQGLGQIIGPNLAATILGAGLGYDGVFTMCATAAFGGMCIYAIMYLRLRKAIPALADAS